MKDNLVKTIATNIKSLRIEARMTQKELGLRMGFKEESAQNMVYFWETGVRSPNKKNLEKLAVLLNKSIDDIITGYKDLEYVDFKKGRTVPLISWVRAGKMHYPIDNLQPGESDGPPVPSTCKDQDCFALRVQGDSMMPEFQEGEIIVVSPNTEAHSGDYVIAKYDSEVTFKRLKIYPDAIILRPLNEKYEEIIIKGKMLKDFKVVGKVVEKIKRY